jgi:hypothetical protein
MMKKTIASKLQELDSLSINLTNITRRKLNIIFSSNFKSSDEFNEYLKKIVIDKLQTIYTDVNLNNNRIWMQLPSVMTSYNENNNLASMNQLNPTSVLLALLFFLFLMMVNIHVYKKTNINNDSNSVSANKKKKKRSHARDILSQCREQIFNNISSSLSSSSSSKNLLTSESFHYQPTSFNQEVVDRLQRNVGPYQPPFWYSPILGE